MAKFNQQPNKSESGANVQKQQNAQAAQGQYGTEFASETNAAEMKKQNARNAQAQGQYGTEFASEANAQEARKQNQKAQANKSGNNGQQE